MEPTINKKAAKISVGIVVLLLVFLAALLVLGLITKVIVLDKQSGFDEKVFQFFARFTSPKTTFLFTAITFFGSTTFLLPAYLLLSFFYLFYKKDRIQSINIIAIGLTSSALLFSMKDFFQRHRPFDPLISPVAGFSFPSGHSFSSFTFCGILIYVIWKADIPPYLKWISSVAIFIFAFFIAASRVYLHVHYASDVIAGFCLSIIWLTISLWVLKTIFGNKNQKIVQNSQNIVQKD